LANNVALAGAKASFGACEKALWQHSIPWGWRHAGHKQQLVWLSGVAVSGFCVDTETFNSDRVLQQAVLLVY